MDIFVNYEKVTVNPVRGSKHGAQMSISYDLAAELAGLTGCMPSIAWKTPDRRFGILSPKERLTLVEGMQVLVTIEGVA